ncbi:hypothetical protein [Methylobacterium sp. J-067]|uniref:hypothetical protein n=1 Tax=Methylobacterium sp. J-067 TaxID=2836648 RepID=UPI001FBB973E|nr:hypothetical protein [Methylobacterium sp. J-067]MCJ2023935.1 hypothetical protein [Methylobacterium sp. J-067]
MTDLPLFDPYKALAEIRREAAERNPTPQKLPQKLPQAYAGAIREQDHRVNPTSAAFAGSAGVPTQHAPRAHTNKEEERKENAIKSYTYARQEASGGAYGMDRRGTPAEPAEVAEISLSHSDTTIYARNAAAEVLGDGLRKWRSALSELSAERIPCPGYRPEEWAGTLARALDFLDRFGPQAEALGWTAVRLFGVHRVGGIVRVDTCGALVLPSAGAVRAITATEVAFDCLTYREKPGQPQGVPIWDFAR